MFDNNIRYLFTNRARAKQSSSATSVASRLHRARCPGPSLPAARHQLSTNGPPATKLASSCVAAVRGLARQRRPDSRAGWHRWSDGQRSSLSNAPFSAGGSQRTTSRRVRGAFVADGQSQERGSAVAVECSSSRSSGSNRLRTPESRSWRQTDAERALWRWRVRAVAAPVTTTAVSRPADSPRRPVVA